MFLLNTQQIYIF